MTTLLRILNTLLLIGILCVLILIFVHVRQPIAVQEPVAVQGWSIGPSLPNAKPIPVTIENEPLQVEISR